jgi:signal transduction histidine kinase/ActR/RegA family two-component response regulator
LASLRIHRLLIAGCVILPAGLFLLAAVSSRTDALREGRETVMRTADVLEEHASKVFETEELVLERADAFSRKLTWDEIAMPRTTHFLRRLKAPLDQTVAIWIADANGDLRAGSLPWSPGDSVGERDFFKVQRDRDAGTYISPPFRGRATDRTSFAVSRRRTTADGHFDGTVHIAANPAYFVRFFEQAAPNLPYAATLVRVDGVILARKPEAPVGASVAPDSALMRAASENPDRGSYLTRSVIDNVERFYTYRKVGGYPLYVTFGVAPADMLGRWRHNLVVFGAAATVAAMMLGLVSYLALRAVKTERTLTGRLQAAAGEVRREVALREEAEQHARHAVKMEAIGQLTGSIAHDFNNLLMAMLGSLEILRGRLPSDDARSRKLLDTALRGVERGTALTQRLLAFGRRQTLRPEPVVLQALVRGMSDLLTSSVGAGVKIVTDFHASSAPVLVDANQLELALLNLAGNARDAMDGAGVLRITGREEQADFGTSGEHPTGFGVLSVTDTGAGMDEEMLARAAEPFFTTKPIGAGTGLGLSMVHGLAAQSGGKLVLRSVLGRGTTAELWLPLAAATEEAAPRPVETLPAAGLAAPGRRVVVLVVDDDPLVLISAGAMLEDLGHTVFEAMGAEQALGLIRAGTTVDVVLTDISMPGMSGLQLAAELRHMMPDLPVVLATGFAERADVIASGFPLLAKPFDRLALSGAIEARIAARKVEPADARLSAA